MVASANMNHFRAPALKRFVALLLISLTCHCIGFEDLFALNSCGEDRATLFPESRALVMSQTAGSQQPSPADCGNRDHDCFCCCRHVLVAGFFRPIQILSVSFIVSDPLKAVSSV